MWTSGVIRKISLAVSLLALVLGVWVHALGIFGGTSYLVNGGGEGDILYAISLFYAAPLFTVAAFGAFVSREFWPKKIYFCVFILTGLVFMQLLVAFAIAKIL